MDRFVLLFEELENTNSTKAKVQALCKYFDDVDDQEKLWAIVLFSGRRPKRSVTTTLLRIWAAEEANVPDWLFEDTYHIVGDLAETIAKILPPQQLKSTKSLSEWIHDLLLIKGKDEEDKKSFILQAWRMLGYSQRFIFNKLITGGFRVGVSHKLMTTALAKHLDQEAAVVMHKLMGDWTPKSVTFQNLLIKDDPLQKLSRPYPFYLCHPLDKEPRELGPYNEWIAEYKWDGMRGQLIKRGEHLYLWSRGEELITDRFPEFADLTNCKFDFVIDGELVVYKDDVLDFQHIQKRIGLKKPSKKILASHPVKMIAYDIMEYNGEDKTKQSQSLRREILESVVYNIENQNIVISQIIKVNDWDDLKSIRANARDMNAEGLMLKSKKGQYQFGRKKGDWYKWKLDPYTLDAVMLYAQRGHGRRSNLFSDYTFALRDGEKLIPFAKAYSGLTDAEMQEILKFVKKNTIERFGPVHSVKPMLVFEIAFDGISNSRRHKSGIAVRFPRIVKWRKEKSVDSINTLIDAQALIKS